MKDNPSQHDFELNSAGQYSNRQIRRLLYFWFRDAILFLLIGITALFGEYDWFTISIGLFCFGGVAFYSRGYGTDLWKKPLLFSSGIIEKKEEIRRRGPTRYYIGLAEDEDLIQVAREQYLAIQEGGSYELFVTGYARWLLSYKSVETTESTDAGL